MTDTGWTFEGRRVIESENAPDPNGIKHLGTSPSDYSPFLSRIVNTCDLHGAIYDVTDPVQNMRAAYDYHTRRSVHNSKERTMATLYKPVLIETVEQAEALPAFTVASYIDGDVRAAIKTIDGIWESIPSFYGEEAHFSEDFIGWTALVPIEAEEETTTANDYGDLDTPYSRLVTPWEEA